MWLGLAALVLVGACSSPPVATPQVERHVPAHALNPDVHQGSIQQTICLAGYTADVRPSPSYTKGVKAKLLREQNLPHESAKDYELDHVIPLALGGHPRAMENLALQPWSGDNSAKKKDQLERRLQVLVCAGQLALDTARAAIYFDWKAAYLKYVTKSWTSK